MHVNQVLGEIFYIMYIINPISLCVCILLPVYACALYMLWWSVVSPCLSDSWIMHLKICLNEQLFGQCDDIPTDMLLLLFQPIYQGDFLILTHLESAAYRSIHIQHIKCFQCNYWGSNFLHTALAFTTFFESIHQPLIQSTIHMSKWFNIICKTF